MTDPAAHRAEIESWREARYADLRRDTGWLTLVGLGWLRPGVNDVGAGPSADVVLPAGPRRVGTVTVERGAVRATGAFVHDGRPARDLRLVSDQEGEPTMLAVDRLRICVIERAGRLALRTWDLDAEARHRFNGIDHWPVDLGWRVAARFEPIPDRTVLVPDVLGTTDEQSSPGDVAFELGGATYRLQALPGGDSGELWLIFGDATNGSETYGGGRFLYTDPPAADGRLVLDFNRAYNPPCVFTSHATCPLPWPANRLPVRIEAGERLPAAGH